MKILSSHVLRDHVFIGGIAALILCPVWGGLYSFLFWTSTVLIDLDHLVLFFYHTRFKVFGIHPLFQFYEKVFGFRDHPDYLTLEIFHTVEFLLLFAGLAVWVAPILQPILWGFLFHVFIDIIHLLRFKALGKRSHSILEYFQRRKKIRAQGKDPDRLLTEVVKSLN